MIAVVSVKWIFSIFIFLLSAVNVCATEKIEVTLDKCVDGDTAWFVLNDEKIKARFLAIDTPESTNKVEPFGKEASDYTCNLLTNASKIEIEYDDNSDKLDKYNRHLVWVFVDDQLLQNSIIQKGLGQVSYIYGDYKYLTQLRISEEVAKTNQIGIWEENDNYLYYIIGSVIVVLIICLISQKYRKKTVNKIKNNFKKEFKKKLKNY